MTDRQIWFLTGSQGLYGEDVLAQVAAQSKTVSDALAGHDGIVAESSPSRCSPTRPRCAG